jgi:putative transcriptional regulator
MKFHKAMPGLDHPFEIETGDIHIRQPFRADVKRAASLLPVCLLSVFLAAPARGAENNKNKAEFLIARNQINDPYFRHSVVLMLPESETQLVVGLIINKPTRVTLGKLLPTRPEFRNRIDPAYFGGPVDVRVPSVVFRSSTAPENAVRLYGNVYLTFDADLISKAFESPQPGSKPRLFLGRAQWSPGQLQNEIRRGGWYRIQAAGDLVFNSHPENLWRTLHARAAPSKYIRYRLPPGGRQPSASKVAAM